MRKHPACWALAAVLLLSSEALVQMPADFSGTWVLAPSGRAAGASTGATPPTLSAAGDMGSGWGSEITITQDAKALTVVYTYFHPRDIQPPFSLKYLLDGTPSMNTLNIGRGPQDQVSRASWEAASLVITTTHHFVNPQNGQAMTSDTRQAVSLESPAVLLIETTRSAVLGGRSSTTTTRYQRKTTVPEKQ